MTRKRVRRLYTLLMQRNILPAGLGARSYYDEAVPVRRSTLTRAQRRIPRPKLIPRYVEFCAVENGKMTRVHLVACVHALGVDCDKCSADGTLDMKKPLNIARRLAYLCCEIFNRDPRVNLSQD